MFHFRCLRKSTYEAEYLTIGCGSKWKQNENGISKPLIFIELMRFLLPLPRKRRISHGESGSGRKQKGGICFHKGMLIISRLEVHTKFSFHLPPQQTN